MTHSASATAAGNVRRVPRPRGSQEFPYYPAIPIYRFIDVLLIPWILKFLLAPVMDRYQLSRLRPKRSWITLMQMTIIGLIVTRSQRSPVDDLFVIFGIAFSIFRPALYRETLVT